MKKILYVMHISWGWIKQRPHFMAEELEKCYKVDVLCKRMYREKKANSDTSVNLIFPFRLPLERFDIIKKLNRYINKLYLRKIAHKYDILWFTAPSDDAIYLLSRNKKSVVVYDCMDDMLSFPMSDEEREKMQMNEVALYKRADIVLATSNYLKNKLIDRYGNKKGGITTVNNALQLPSVSKEIKIFPKILNSYLEDKVKKIVYIGTISEWVDIDLCTEMVNNFPNSKVYLWGPYKHEIKTRVTSDRVVFCGAIDHKYIYSVMDGADILIMPFILNELILSVNPVKLYEYIMAGKPCVAPHYGESIPFEDYVYLYQDHSNCLEIINKILSGEYGAKQPNNKCLEFARMNTWEQRGKTVMNILEKN